MSITMVTNNAPRTEGRTIERRDISCLLTT
jgi:hypothetical protein